MKISPRLLALLPVLVLGLITAHAQDAAAMPAPAPAPDAATPPPTAAAPDSPATPAKVDPAKEAEIRKLLELSGTVKLTSEGVKQMIESFRQQNSSLPASFWEHAEKEINVQELVDKTIPLYDKYYSLEDLKAMNAFYQSPAGQRMLESAPMLMRDSSVIGQDWGRTMALRLNHEIVEARQAESTAPAPTAPADTSSTPAPTPAPAPAAATAPSAPATP